MDNETNMEPYEMPAHEMPEGGALGKSPVADIITATGNLQSDKFWMVVLIIAFLALGGGTIFWINNLYKELGNKDKEIGRKDTKIELLEKDLKDCPEKAIQELKQTHITIQELRGEIKSTNIEVDESNRELRETNNKLKQIEKGL
jgi:septal ring factor EnvC (AmiA/AmiB activator)